MATHALTCSSAFTPKWPSTAQDKEGSRCHPWSGATTQHNLSSAAAQADLKVCLHLAKPKMRKCSEPNCNWGKEGHVQNLPLDSLETSHFPSETGMGRNGIFLCSECPIKWQFPSKELKLFKTSLFLTALSVTRRDSALFTALLSVLCNQPLKFPMENISAFIQLQSSVLNECLEQNLGFLK